MLICSFMRRGHLPWSSTVTRLAPRQGACRRGGGAESVELDFVAGAGHLDSEPGLVDAMVCSSNRFKDVLSERGGVVDSGGLKGRK
jgi:hypothetical protein